VVNIISEAFIEAANYTSIDAPADVSEWDLAGLTREPSQVVKPPRVKESAFSMECVLEHYYDMKVRSLQLPARRDQVLTVCVVVRVRWLG
jgi:flavin reductase (DIM6/NTAB) family NADH-FMN oxidoreductase RutF